MIAYGIVFLRRGMHHGGVLVSETWKVDPVLLGIERLDMSVSDVNARWKLKL